MLRGRVQVSVPEVFNDGRLAWAEPCVPYAGNQVGHFALPPVGASAWVQFERGDPDYPVIAGCQWQAGESPAPGLRADQDDRHRARSRSRSATRRAPAA